tara:strand:- start:117 stop:434 length:318 start_codon:yes stop_codon:yes gene_type:complete
MMPITNVCYGMTGRATFHASSRIYNFFALRRISGFRGRTYLNALSFVSRFKISRSGYLRMRENVSDEIGVSARIFGYAVSCFLTGKRQLEMKIFREHVVLPISRL